MEDVTGYGVDATINVTELMRLSDKAGITVGSVESMQRKLTAMSRMLTYIMHTSNQKTLVFNEQMFDELPEDCYLSMSFDTEQPQECTFELLVEGE